MENLGIQSVGLKSVGIKSSPRSSEKSSNKRLTAIYLRLSKEDVIGIMSEESNSISNQKLMLTNYAKKHNFANIKVFIDDGISGVTFRRSGFMQMFDLIKRGKVETLIVKDMSRLGRNYLEVGKLTEEVFPLYGVRLIAVNDNVDSAVREDDFSPFRNIMNELYAKNTSKQIRCALKVKSSQGFPIGSPPYGYKRAEGSKQERKNWVVDEYSASVVKQIYKMRLEGNSLDEIVKFLRKKETLIPSQYAFEKGYRVPNVKNPKGKCLWFESVVKSILTNQVYMGDVVNFKTYSLSFKLKQRLLASPENREIHKGKHEAIIERSIWEEVQKTFGIVKHRKLNPKNKNMFSKLLKCSDCGSNLNCKTENKNCRNQYFFCRNHKEKNGLCNTTHHIRLDVLTDFVTGRISEIVRFANSSAREFTKVFLLSLMKREKREKSKEIKVCGQDVSKQNETQSELQILNEVKALKERESKIDVLIEKLYEDRVFGNVSEERFSKLLVRFENEQEQINFRVKEFEPFLERVKKEASEQISELDLKLTPKEKIESFLELTKKHKKFQKLNSEILHEFIEKIEVFHRVEKIEKREIFREKKKRKIGEKNSGKNKEIEVKNLKKVKEKIRKIRNQKVIIFFKFIGKVEVPALKKDEIITIL
jgi:DNA invertase Pin-like site-specific DNA recombinase